MSQSVARITSLASVRASQAVEYLAQAGYATKTAMTKGKDRKKVIDRAAEGYVRFHADAMTGLEFDPRQAGDVLRYMTTVPRCGCPDLIPGAMPVDPDMLKRFERGQHGRWPHYNREHRGVLGIRVHVNFTTIGRASGHRLERGLDHSVREGLRFWERVCGLRFTIVPNRQGCNISIRDGRYDGPMRTLAMSLLVQKRDTADTHLVAPPQMPDTQLYDHDEQWSDVRGYGISLAEVIAHEIFHAVGFGHSNDQRDVMFPNMIPGRANLPGPQETRVAREEYPGPPRTDDAPVPGPTPPTPTPPTPDPSPSPKFVQVDGVVFGKVSPAFPGIADFHRVTGRYVGEWTPGAGQVAARIEAEPDEAPA